MTLYAFETQLVVDADGDHVIMNNAPVSIYDPNDTAMASPLPLVDPAGLPLANPLTSSPQGFLPPFQATLPQVMWATVEGGVYGYLNSFQGVLDAALAAQAAAEAAAGGGGGGGAGTGSSPVQYVTGTSTATRPTASTDVMVIFLTTGPTPPVNAIPDLDIWIQR